MEWNHCDSREIKFDTVCQLYPEQSVASETGILEFCVSFIKSLRREEVMRTRTPAKSRKQITTHQRTGIYCSHALSLLLFYRQYTSIAKNNLVFVRNEYPKDRVNNANANPWQNPNPPHPGITTMRKLKTCICLLATTST
jgi:hypothetical protein